MSVLSSAPLPASFLTDFALRGNGVGGGKFFFLRSILSVSVLLMGCPESTTALSRVVLAGPSNSCVVNCKMDCCDADEAVTLRFESLPPEFSLLPDSPLSEFGTLFPVNNIRLKASTSIVCLDSGWSSGSAVTIAGFRGGPANLLRVFLMASSWDCVVLRSVRVVLFWAFCNASLRAMSPSSLRPS